MALLSSGSIHSSTNRVTGPWWITKRAAHEYAAVARLGDPREYAVLRRSRIQLAELCRTARHLKNQTGGLQLWTCLDGLRVLVSTTPRPEGPLPRVVAVHNRPGLTPSVRRVAAPQEPSHWDQTSRPSSGLSRREPLEESIRRAMGRREMTALEVVGALAESGCLPTCTSPRQRVSHTLATHTKTFERVERGVYRVRRAL